MQGTGTDDVAISTYRLSEARTKETQVASSLTITLPADHGCDEGVGGNARATRQRDPPGRLLYSLRAGPTTATPPQESQGGARSYQHGKHLLEDQRDALQKLHTRGQQCDTTAMAR